MGLLEQDGNVEWEVYEKIDLTREGWGTVGGISFLHCVLVPDTRRNPRSKMLSRQNGRNHVGKQIWRVRVQVDSAVEQCRFFLFVPARRQGATRVARENAKPI